MTRTGEREANDATDVSLTGRQQVLFDRLVTLGHLATSDELPIRVLEIRGFGSFFRGKHRPKDVDLIFRVQWPDHTLQFKRFVELIEEIRHDESYQQQFQTPKEALLVAHQRGDQPRLFGHEDGGVERDLFGEWSEGYSWNMLFPDTCRGELAIKSPQEYTKRLIKRRLANLNIVQFLNPNDTTARPLGLRCGYTVSIWSNDRPDVRSNLEQLLSEESVASNVMRELAYFNVQLPLIQAEASLLQATIELLFTIPRRRKTGEGQRQEFEKWLSQQKALRDLRRALEEAQRLASAYEKHESDEPEPVPAEVAELPLNEAVVLADQLRKKIKAQYERVDVLTDLQRVLYRFKRGAAQTDLPPKKYVVSEMLERGGRRQRKVVAACLRELGLPVPERLP